MIDRFEQTYRASYPEQYPTTEGEQADVLALWEALSVVDRQRFDQDVGLYFENTLEPTLGGFCEWRRERA